MFLPLNCYRYQFSLLINFFYLSFMSFDYEVVINLAPQPFFFLFFIIFTFVVFKINNYCPSFDMKKK